MVPLMSMHECMRVSRPPRPGPFNNNLHTKLTNKNKLAIHQNICNKVLSITPHIHKEHCSPVRVEGAEAHESLAHGVEALRDTHNEQVVRLLRVELRQATQQTSHSRVIGTRR